MTRHTLEDYCIFAGIPEKWIERDYTERRDAGPTSHKSKFLHHSGKHICSRSIQSYGNHQQVHASNNPNPPKLREPTVSAAS